MNPDQITISSISEHKRRVQVFLQHPPRLDFRENWHQKRRANDEHLSLNYKSLLLNLSLHYKSLLLNLSIHYKSLLLNLSIYYQSLILNEYLFPIKCYQKNDENLSLHLQKLLIKRLWVFFKCYQKKALSLDCLVAEQSKLKKNSMVTKGNRLGMNWSVLI